MKKLDLGKIIAWVTVLLSVIKFGYEQAKENGLLEKEVKVENPQNEKGE